MRPIAALAETDFVAVAPQNPVGPIGTAFSAQLALVIPNLLILERLREDVAWRDTVVDEPVRVVDGYIEPCDRPGVSLAPIEEEAAAHADVAPHPYRSYLSDGSVVDD